MSVPPLEVARQRVAEAAALITDARRQVAEGHVIHLAPLEEVVRTACEAVRGLPAESLRPEDRLAARSDLETLLYDLDALSTEMTSRFGEQGTRDSEPSTPGKAARPTIAALMPKADKPPPKTSFET